VSRIEGEEVIVMRSGRPFSRGGDPEVAESAWLFTVPAAVFAVLIALAHC